MRNGTYNYDLAQCKYETRLKLRGRKPVFTKEMKNTVISLLEEDYSLGQIKGRINVEGFSMISHETIFRRIWDKNVRKVLCTRTFDEKERSTTNVGIHMREGDTSLTALI